MTEVVDCHALATSFQASRPMDDVVGKSLADRFGIDGSRSLTELEGVDRGDAEDWGDLAEINALRYLSLARLSPADVSLLMTHGESPDLMLPLALVLLELDPIQEAEHYPGDLLLALARMTAGRQQGSIRRVPGPVTLGDDADAVKERIEDAFARFWIVFESRAVAKELSSDTVDVARHQLVHGPPLVTFDWYHDLEDLMNVLCEAKAWLHPPRIIARAHHEAFFARNQRERLRIVAPGDEPAAERTARHSFRRVAVFEIAQQSKGVRLLVRSPSAIEDWRGTSFQSVDEIKNFARSCYGVGTDAWKAAGKEETSPADHYEVQSGAQSRSG